MKAQNIILIGPMGSGKSTISNILANKLHRDFRDSDHFIEENTGVDIGRIFDIEGENGFRDRESNALIELLGHDNQVVATGGGIGQVHALGVFGRFTFDEGRSRCRRVAAAS